MKRAEFKQLEKLVKVINEGPKCLRVFVNEAIKDLLKTDVNLIDRLVLVAVREELKLAKKRKKSKK